MDASTSCMVSLNGNNWTIWKLRMEDLLFCKDLDAPLQNGLAKPENMSQEWKKLDRKVLDFIWQWLNDLVFHHVSNESFAHSLWKNLESLYERKIAWNKAFLIRKLVN